ncbi:MarP family serine protease [Frankia sp. CNm7]|uniref:MarP family serine protease n=1 Tax=Frankia nepalensis TaxID=1836974 RepID=A0A937RUR0_9ACTN|nr:MarP family serine protease [Frankia nepalensis]MBL7496244.1 MarP family serine protease [Frankia nepalensis]MBL7515584.1 MarP family serine protease [Frankia nepalensis]MBL7521256.1 MarP family serine protease [Frankia nepalensis]MBL7632246.1 MarP family serine protease [Frankia nepalensis]
MFNLLDAILLVVVLLFAVSGYRQGFVLGALTFVGFIGGGIIGAQIALPLTELLGLHDHGAVIALVTVLLLACLGQAAGSAAGVALRDRLTWRIGERVDALAGAALSGLSALLVAWLLATAVERSPFATVAREVRGSAVLTTVDDSMPSTVRETFASLRRLADTNGFPAVFAGIGGESIVAADPPDPAVVTAGDVVAATASILKIRGIAPSCSRQVEGSGFVYAPQRVMTNAHVVAGVREPTVEVGDRTLAAQVVVFDPERDVAVLYVPDLNRPPLRFQTEPDGHADDNAVIAGFPEDGPYRTEPARIRNRQTARAPDIYSRGSVVRDIFAVRGTVLPGNSGGPLLSPGGTVYGVVFAAATEDRETGYVLTADEVSIPAQAGERATEAVNTQGCR